VSDPASAATAALAESSAPALSKRDKRKSYGKTAKVGALWSVGRESVTQLLAIPTTLILARLLTPADFGIAAAATFFIQLGKRMGNMGLNTALVRMKDVREEHRASVFFINFVFGMLAFATLMLVAPSIGAYYGDDRVTGALRVASLIFLVNFFGAVEFAVLQRDMKFKEMAFVEWTGPMFFFPVAVAMAWAGFGYWSLLVGQLVSNAAITASKVYYGRWRPSLKFTRTGLAETVPFGMGVYAKRLLTYAAENLDSLIVGGLFGVTSLGFYDKAFNAADNLSNRLSLGSTVMFRIFAIIQEERERFLRAYHKVVLAGTIVTLPLFAGLIVAAPQFVVVVFGGQWRPAVVPFQFLCAAAALRLVSGYASSAVQASGQIWGEVWRKVAQVVLIVGLIFLLRPWGIEGAAFGVFAATLTLALLMQGLVARVIGLTWKEALAPLLPSAAAAVGTALIVAATTLVIQRTAPDLPDWVILIAQVGAAGLFWGVFTLYAPFGSLRSVVDEVIDDLAPAGVRRVLAPFRRSNRAASNQP
jgi:teichuronic acid exporter